MEFQNTSKLSSYQSASKQIYVSYINNFTYLFLTFSKEKGNSISCVKKRKRLNIYYDWLCELVCPSLNTTSPSIMIEFTNIYNIIGILR